MRRLNINNIQVDTTLKKNVIIKNSLQIPEEFRGNLKNSMICPITYNNLSDNVIYYDGDEYTITGGTIKKNGNNIFTVNPTHLTMTEHTSDLDRNSDNGAVKTGSVINYNFNNGTVTGTINVVDCGYDYFLRAATFNGKWYITLFPVVPTHYKDIKSWEISGALVTEQYRYFINPFHELVEINNNACKVGSTSICNVLFQDFIMSGDTNHILYTAFNNDGYFYSNIEYYGNNWLTSDCILLATSQDGIYYGGFKVKKGDWSIDYYNNTPVQVSYKNKVMVSQIDYAYFTDSETTVVIIGGKTYILNIVNGVDVSIVADRFIVANSPDTYNNTYDMVNNKAFCRNDSYNGGVLWTINNNSLVSDPDKRGTFYVATGINIQGQVKDSPLQGTVWPSFPVWGLEDNNFQLLDVYNETDRVTVEVYKGTKNSPTVPEFAFSLGGFLDYSGYVYPDSINTLYSVAEIDTFTETYSGVQIIKTPAGNFINAMTNKQMITFSYYIGTLSEFSHVFVLRGTIYGITDSGYICRMTIMNNVISSNDLVTKSGIMQFIGNTQDYALFYNPNEKVLYRFDAGLTLSPFKEFSISEPLYYTCRAEDNKIAIATSDSIYVISDNNIFRIESSVNKLAFNKGWLLAGNRAYSSYDGTKILDVEYDTGKIGNTYDTSILLEEAEIMLDDTELKVPSYIEYRIDVGNSIGKVEEISPVNCKDIIRIKPTSNRSEGLFYRIWIKTNCNLMGISINDNVEVKPNLTRNNG